MRVLLDECVHEQLRNHVSGHECQTARYAGLAGLENGELLEAAERAGFDVLLTVDRKIALVVFCGKSVLLEDLLALMPRCLKCLEAIQPGQVVRIGA
jgi:hypothetical protein